MEELESMLKDLHDKNRHSNLNLDDFLGMLKDLIDLLKLLRFKNNLLGCYGKNNNTPYICICLKNIEKEADEHNFNKQEFIDLIKSVFIHEYTHFVHSYYMKQRQRRIDNEALYITKSAMKETIAEHVQRIYISNILKNTAVNNWIVNHSIAGCFPAWGYAGSDIVEKYSCRNLIDDRIVLKKIIAISEYDWRKAYSFIESIDMLNKI